MNTKMTENIYNTLNIYLQEKSNYSPKVINKTLLQSNKYPLVTFNEVNNIPKEQSTKSRVRDTYSGVYYEIEIFAIDKAAANKIISNITICNELKELVDKVMSSYFQLERTLCQPTPNVDKNIYRITMRYTANIWDNKNMLI